MYWRLERYVATLHGECVLLHSLEEEEEEEEGDDDMGKKELTIKSS